MNHEVGFEARPRPLSAGLWTLFSWLRREDRSASSDSLSSVGSDRTVASIAFVTPAHYQTVTEPIALLPQGPPTDSYKKRINDRNVRRQYDRDITLHRKYGLYKGDGPRNYDAFSLPPVRRVKCDLNSRWERDRRAASECVQRKAPHVPGKRRAPPPPNTTAPSSSLGRRSRKRPAPQPPTKILETNKEDIAIIQVHPSVGSMSSSSFSDKHKTDNSDTQAGCKPEKYLKKESSLKNRSEKSFLRHLFDNKKRNSTIDTASVKVLPSISELDKQAAEIIKSSKLKSFEQRNESTKMKENKLDQGDSWFCISCLRKYESAVTSCLYCLPKGNQSNSKHSEDMKAKMERNMRSNGRGAEEKQKLKEMLKEMKDSLPKRPKHEIKNIENQTNILTESPKNSYSTETPTLKVGPVKLAKEISYSDQPSSSNFKLNTVQFNAVTAKHRPDNAPTVETSKNNKADEEETRKICDAVFKPNPKKTMITPEDSKLDIVSTQHTPLKISSLLNPVYVPKNSVPTGSHTAKKKQIAPDHITPANVLPPTEIEKKIVYVKKDNPEPSKVLKDESKNNITTPTTVYKEDEHSKRRDLINKLEQSIAKGDERTAAETAAKLAQLRLSCSVLSFTSQILTQPSTSTAHEAKDYVEANKSDKKDVKEKKKESALKVNKSTEILNNEINKDFKLRPESHAGLDKATITNSIISVPKPLCPERIPVTSKVLVLEEDKHSEKVQEKLKEVFKENDFISISVLVEDREATRGPIQLRIRRHAMMRDLRREAETSLGLASNLQRWIVGRALCVDDTKPVASLAGKDFSAPFYLCIVESEAKGVYLTENINNKVETKDLQNNRKVYKELMQLEQQALVPNAEDFECGVCMEDYPPGGGVVLRECVHIFCKGCLTDIVRHCEEPDVPCPAMGCRGILQEREIRALVTPQDYERWLARGLAAAESKTRNAFHCRTRDCKGWALCEPGVLRFPCPVCKRINCVPCEAIHERKTCEQHRASLKEKAAESCNGPDEDTKTLLSALIKKGEALECPECSAIITKKWGCDWVKCSACKTEICWVTRGRRWGPNGKGDTSGGCRCGVDGKKCHPSCGYCH